MTNTPRYPGDLGKDDDQDGASFHHMPQEKLEAEAVSHYEAWPKKQEVTIDYTNWKGVRRQRRIVPLGLVYCTNEWHPIAQWMIEAIDVEDNREGVKFFPLSNIHAWAPTMSTSGSVIGGPVT